MQNTREHSSHGEKMKNANSRFSGSVFFQPKLTINSNEDVYEKEADSVADKVMRKSKETFFAPQTIQRKCEHCEEEEKIQKKSLSDGITPIQLKTNNEANKTEVNQEFESNLKSSNGNGSALDKDTLAFMNDGFGVDFSSVKIHSNSHSASLNNEINARAFTIGNDIYFNNGEYSPHSESGRHLLAHELTHTIQQNALPNTKSIQRACGSAAIGDPTGCLGSTETELPEGLRYLFNVNCDDFSGDNARDLRISAENYNNNETIDIHGLSSEDGPEDFNVKLSCARALKAKAIIDDVARRKGFHFNLNILSHGPQTQGVAYLNRSVLIVRYGQDTEDPVEESEQPVEVPQCSGIYSDGHNENNDPDHDLDQVRHSGENSLKILAYRANPLGEFEALGDFSRGFFAGTIAESTSDDNDLFNHFRTGNGSRLNFGTSTDMARILGSAPVFTAFHDALRRDMLAFFSTNRTLCGYDGNAFFASNRPGYFSSPIFAFAVLGGYSRIEASVFSNAAGGFDITYKIFDHYGAGVSDANSMLPGLAGLYYLQHFYGVPAVSNTPFIWSTEINRTLW